MSVIVKGMEMPTSCLECRLYNDPWCMAKNRNQWRTAYNRPPKGERQNDCPLIELPTHGDLIDRDALPIHGFSKRGGEWLMYTEADEIMNAPAIIPAEEEET